MHKHLAGRQIDDFSGRNPAVTATNPEITWFLLAAQAFEIVGVSFLRGVHPSAVALEKIIQIPV